MVQYHSNKWQYDTRFLLPYIVASVLMVAVAFVLAPRLAKRIDRRRIAVFIIAFVLLFAVAAVSDVIARTLNAGVLILSTPDSILRFVMVTVPVAVLSALFVDR